MAQLQPAPSQSVPQQDQRARSGTIVNEAQAENANIEVKESDEGKFEREVRILTAQANVIISLLLVVVLGSSGYIIAELIIINDGNADTSLSPAIRTAAYSVTLLATAALSYYGLFFTHRYGGTTQQIRILESAGALLKANNDEFANQAGQLQSEVAQLTRFTDINIRQTQDKLESIVEDGEEIGRIAKSINTNNEETAEMFKIIKEIQVLTKQLRRDIGRNELMKIYYELENSDDNEAGLNKKEYDRFIDRLDKETADAFREVTTFRRMDRNNNGVIEVGEFEQALNDVYEYLDELDRADVEAFNLEFEEVNRE